MNGVHDLGGMHGFGAVPVEDDAAFHADWERVAFALNQLARAAGCYDLDEYRHAVERAPPAEYLGAGYYERWLGAVERLLVEKGVVTEAEIRERLAETDADGVSVGDGTVEGAAPEDRDPQARRRARELFEADRFEDIEGPEPAFEAGDAVRVRNRHPEGHTRVPRYARGAAGTARKHYGSFHLPDAAVEGRERSEPCYSVRFAAAELWGPDTEADAVNIDMWESYLTAADGGTADE